MTASTPMTSALTSAAAIPYLVAVALPSEWQAPEGVPIVYTGIGKLNAALTLSDAILRLRPAMVLNYGTAGAVRAGLHGMMEVASVLQRDMDAEPLAPRGVTPMHEGLHRFDSGREGVVCGTGDSFVRGPDPWFEQAGVQIVDMELYALARTCAHHGLPWRSLKYVSDLADENAGRDWAANIAAGSAAFSAWMKTAY
ncbi:MAG: 5'-methylthioadenosine nucleosidase [Candidatus Protistobacter heckmanni]|nr:5'-methylthioadenosine nucleosidase [Candidatus Protistobacter heckmanni]